MSQIIQQLKKNHNLVLEGENISIWAAVGMAIGVSTGTASDNNGVGIPIRFVLGVATGSYMDNKAKKKER